MGGHFEKWVFLQVEGYKHCPNLPSVITKSWEEKSPVFTNAQKLCTADDYENGESTYFAMQTITKTVEVHTFTADDYENAGSPKMAV